MATRLIRVEAEKLLGKAGAAGSLATAPSDVAFLGFLLEVRGLARGITLAEVLGEIPHQVAPHRPFNANALQYRLKVLGYLSPFVEAPFAAGPIKQRGVLSKRHRQEALVAGPSASMMWFGTNDIVFVDLQW